VVTASWCDDQYQLLCCYCYYADAVQKSTSNHATVLVHLVYG
jgi:hypothetical protein